MQPIRQTQLLKPSETTSFPGSFPSPQLCLGTRAGFSVRIEAATRKRRRHHPSFISCVVRTTFLRKNILPHPSASEPALPRQRRARDHVEVVVARLPAEHGGD